MLAEQRKRLKEAVTELRAQLGRDPYWSEVARKIGRCESSARDMWFRMGEPRLNPPHWNQRNGESIVSWRNRALLAVTICPVCGDGLVRTETGWTCEAQGHIGIIPAGIVQERVREWLDAHPRMSLQSAV